MANKGKTVAVLGTITVVVFALVYFGITLTSNIGKTKTQISSEDAGKQLEKLYKNINVTTAEQIKATRLTWILLRLGIHYQISQSFLYP